MLSLAAPSSNSGAGTSASPSSLPFSLFAFDRSKGSGPKGKANAAGGQTGGTD
jgi:hypothetical protein